MAAIPRRPRWAPYILLTGILTIAACSLVQPVETPVDKQARAKALADGGKHADAARAYADLAAEQPAIHDSYELLSAEQWVAAGDAASARQALALVSDDDVPEGKVWFRMTFTSIPLFARVVSALM